MNGALCLLSVALAATAFGGASVTEGTMRVKTYPFSDPDPVPATATTRYPYFRYDGSTAVGEMRDWRTVTLENDRTRVVLLPEVGGKVWAATDKVSGQDFLYCNRVMKFRDIAMRGPWLSGGIEYNFGIIGHAPSSSTPVDWLARTNADGSVSCFVSSAEYITRTVWQVEVRLPNGADGFETHVTWFNASGLASPLYHWMNAAYSLRGDPQFVFPGSTVIGHEGEIGSRTWPFDGKGRKLDVYRNNAFGGPKSYHVLPGNNGFYAIWWPDRGFGSAHRSLSYEKFGRKIWLWALSREGGIWEDLLTDADGQYTELQSGLCFNQPRRGTYRTPFKHPTFAAGATMTFAERWSPVRDLKDVSADIAAPQPVSRPVDAQEGFDWESAWGHYVRGVQCLRERNDVTGAEELRAAIARDGFLGCAYGALAGYEMRRGNLDEVHALCRQALAIDAYDAEANYLDGFAFFSAGDQVTARERLGVAALSPAFGSAALALVARGYLREGRPAEADEAARKALSFNPQNLDARLVRIVAARGTPAARELAEAALEELPLFHGARYELARTDPGVRFMRYVRNELPAETYLELGSWYEETGLGDDARRLFALAGESPLAKVRLGAWASAKRLPVAGAFPFRRESLPALERAVAEDGHWKFRYLLAVLRAYLDFGEEADRLLDGCGDEPDEEVFYLYRASRRTGERALADLRRAERLGGSWRTGDALYRHHAAATNWPAALAAVKPYAEKYPAANRLKLDFANALAKSGRSREAIDYMKTIVVLPSEHRDNAVGIWVLAWRDLALDALRRGDQAAAKRAVAEAVAFPENLGVGRPFELYPNGDRTKGVIGDWPEELKALVEFRSSGS